MGCNSRASYWDLSVTERDSLLNSAPIVCFGSQTTEEDFLADLKLGSLGDSNNLLGNNSSHLLMDSSSSLSSHKRVRANRDTVHVPSCMVDGCVADLSKCREYHRRHRVCETHSKTTIVTIGGQEQRFCQQCSRFHSLGEFDESKRSCRKRLDRHNRRRRKPQPHSSSLNPSHYITSPQGSTFISYGTQCFSNSAVATSSWNEAVKPQNNHLYTLNSQLNRKTSNLPSSFPQGYSGEKQCPFLRSAAHLPQPHLSNPITTFGFSGGSSSNHKLRLSDGFNLLTTNSDRASSLLSSSHSEILEFNPTHFVRRPTQASSIPSTHYNSLAVESPAAMDSSSLAADSRNNVNMDCPEIVANDNVCHQTITFSWG